MHVKLITCLWIHTSLSVVIRSVSVSLFNLAWLIIMTFWVEGKLALSPRMCAFSGCPLKPRQAEAPWVEGERPMVKKISLMKRDRSAPHLWPPSPAHLLPQVLWPFILSSSSPKAHKASVCLDTVAFRHSTANARLPLCFDNAFSLWSQLGALAVYNVGLNITLDYYYVIFNDSLEINWKI